MVTTSCQSRATSHHQQQAQQQPYSIPVVDDVVAADHTEASRRRQDRRTMLCQGSSLAAAAAAAFATTTVWGITRVAAAETTGTKASSAAAPMETINALLDRLHDIPTFCIVSPQGAAYMVYKSEQNMAVGYAFATFRGALAVLSDAQRTAAEKGYSEVWKDATITTIPLDIAVRLSLKKRSRTSQKDQILDTLLMVIPGAVSSVCLMVAV